MSRILKQKPIEEHSLYDASALHMRQNHDSSDDEGPSQSNIDQTRIQSIHLDPKVQFILFYYHSIVCTDINVFLTGECSCERLYHIISPHLP